MRGGFCDNWDGAANGLPDGHWSGTKRRSGDGNRSAGRSKKKREKRGPHDRLHRRKRTEPKAAPLPDLGATRTDAGAAISLQLEDAVGDGGRDLVELLFSPLSQHDSQPAGDRVPHPPATPSARQAADRLGWPAESPQPNGVGLRAPAARALVVGVSAGLRSGTNPVEYLWAHWKHHELPNFCPDSYGELSYHARQALRRMRRRPMLVCAFLQQAELFPL